MRFELVKPSGMVCAVEAEHVYVTGEAGAFGVLEGHAPLIATLRPGRLSVRTAQWEKTFCVGYGMVEVQPDGVTVLSEDAIEVGLLKHQDIEHKRSEIAHQLAALKAEETAQREKMERHLVILQAQAELLITHGGSPTHTGH